MYKKGTSFTLLFLAYLFMLILQACYQQNCGGGYNTGSILITAELKKIEGINSDSSAPQLIVKSFDQNNIGTRYDSLGIDVRSNRVYSINKGFHGLADAYACDPAVPEAIVKEIIITSSEDYNPEFLKGSNLVKLMSVRKGYDVKGHKVDTLMANTNLNPFENNFYTFNIPPSDDKIHNFTIIYILKDGKEYVSSIEKVLIKK